MTLSHKDLLKKLSKHAAGFDPAAFDALVQGIIESEARHGQEEDEDDLFERSGDILPDDADEAMEGPGHAAADAYSACDQACQLARRCLSCLKMVAASGAATWPPPPASSTTMHSA